MTAFQYVVLQYVPDVARQESVNVGVVVVDPAASAPSIRILKKSDAARLKWLGVSDDIAFLQDVADDLVQSSRGPEDTIALLGTAHEQWGGTVRALSLRAALHEDASELCDELYDRYVANPRTRKRPQYRDRRAVRRRVTSAFRSQLPKEAVQSHVTVPGRFDAYRFDVGLGNGDLLHVIETLSFEAPRDTLQTDVDACAWAIQDVHKTTPGLPITVVTFGAGSRLDAAERIYDEVGARMIREPQIDAWVRGVTSELEPHFSPQPHPDPRGTGTEGRP